MQTMSSASFDSISPRLSRKLVHLGTRFAVLLLILVVAVTVVAAKGRKYGLFVGINDYGSAQARLYGAVNDARNLRNLVTKRYGFARKDTKLLTDNGAKRAAIIGAIRDYQRLVRAGDLFLFTYSGHGTVFPDASSEELDETKEISMDILLPSGPLVLPRGLYDSALVPVDSEGESGKPWGNLILDDELYNLFAAFTKKGAQVVFIADMCHAGSIAKARFINGALPKLISPLTALKLGSIEELLALKSQNPKKVGPRSSLGSYLALAASQDDQFSLDVDGDTPNAGGLFTKTMLSVLRTGAAQPTYLELMADVQHRVRDAARTYESDQTPQLDARFGDANLKVFGIQPLKRRPGT